MGRAALAGALLLAPAFGGTAGAGETLARRVASMGTLLTLEVEAQDRGAALAAAEAAVRALEAVEARISTWREDSELSRLNRAPVGRPQVLGVELAEDLARGRDLWEATGGAFDPALGALVCAWDLRGAGRVPEDGELERARAASGMARILLDGRRAVKLDAGVRFEEGGFGKGIGLDAAVRELARSEATSAVLDFGGQVALFGERERTFPLAHPLRRGEPVLELRVASGSFATSANSERARRSDGVVIGHVLDPRSGRPAPDFGSVTVWAPDATAADAASTALFVLGPERALEWAAAREGFEALLLEVEGDALRVRATAGWEGRLQPLVPDLSIEITGAPEAR